MKLTLKLLATFFVLFFYVSFCHAQAGKKKNVKKDSLNIEMLDTVIVNAWLKASVASYMPDVEGTKIYSGKKTNSVMLSDKTNGLPLNLGRTALARIPGLNMWEMDGAGTQLNIGSRGTDPHRSIEMNMRQNGYNTNSDVFGYPENHYSVPLQAIHEVQLVRGSAALQFGPQFGGMMNYKIKQGDSAKPFSLEAEQTVGGNNLYNAFTSVGGTKGKLNYYAFYDTRRGDGWRNNANFDYHTYYASIGLQLSSKANIALQFSRMDYVQQIAGGLTDAQFKQDPQQSVRARNFFQPVINIPAVIFKYNFSANTHLEITANGLFGQRNSVQFINAANVPDTFNTSIGSYNTRQVDRDYYTSFTTEARLLHIYKIGKMNGVLSGGLRYFTGLTKRRQKGVGTTGSNFDLSLTSPYGIDLRLNTYNFAAFAENIFQLSRKFSITPGVRYELIDTKMTGVINNANTPVTFKNSRSFPLFGAGLQYKFSSATQLYGNISQAYRPYLYSNVTPADRLDKIDPALKDSKGYDIDLGYRGHYKNILQFDINGFYLFYGNKVGLVSQVNTNGSNYLFTTNIGNSVAKGAEAFVELSISKWLNSVKPNIDISIFNSLAYNDAKYTSGSINRSGVNVNVKGNYVENAPLWINKTGVEFRYKNFSANWQYSVNSKTYNDAFNTVSSAAGITGIIPAWHLWDWSCNWKFAKHYHVSAGINNFTNEKYFNRRITYYPGPGILPADGRTFYISFGIKI
ncbi:MAG: TonB-dependent receptor [Ferruginibacter sp.]